MNSRERQELDRHITGNYGEDQFRDDPIVVILRKIIALPQHPCDDARNLSCLEIAKRLASEALEIAEEQ